MKIRIEGNLNFIRILPAENAAAAKPFAYDVFHKPDVIAQGNKLIIMSSVRRLEIEISPNVIDSINGVAWTTIVQSETAVNTINEAIMDRITDILSQQP